MAAPMQQSASTIGGFSSDGISRALLTNQDGTLNTTELSPADAPAGSGEQITPNDSNNLIVPTRGIYVGVAGDLTVIMATNGQKVVFSGIMAGMIHPIMASKVFATGTSAAGLVGVW